MKHYEVIIMVKNAQPIRKGVIAKDVIEAINKAIASVEDAGVADVERVMALGVVDIA